MRHPEHRTIQGIDVGYLFFFENIQLTVGVLLISFVSKGENRQQVKGHIEARKMVQLARGFGQLKSEEPLFLPPLDMFTRADQRPILSQMGSQIEWATRKPSLPPTVRAQYIEWQQRGAIASCGIVATAPKSVS